MEGAGVSEAAAGMTGTRGVLVRGGKGVGPGGVEVEMGAGPGRAQLASKKARRIEEMRTDPDLIRGDEW